jgi:hypothetical protein
MNFGFSRPDLRNLFNVIACGWQRNDLSDGLLLAKRAELQPSSCFYGVSRAYCK